MKKSNSSSPIAIVSSFWLHRKLILNLTKREVSGRYKGSVFGILWSFFNPIFMLVVYTFVFSFIFNARWSTESTSRAEFALVLFAGLIVFNFFSECAIKSPGLILSNVNYVKKVIFPLEILPIISACSALFHAAISIVVWLIFYTIEAGIPTYHCVSASSYIITIVHFCYRCRLVAVFFRRIFARCRANDYDLGHCTHVLITYFLSNHRYSRKV
ncbi:ABC-2 type transporter [Serratia fonticola]|uniref:ABC-2 type transporter n=1 Tax=Serratia fonticola TaxID=47917 RepID=A0A4U9TU13_SERFO|nr:ABC-2 type transporter [Serratia fonticola]